MSKDDAEGSSVPAELSPIQRDVLVGTLLGDGCLARHGRYHRLHVKQKEAHHSLVEFKYEVFREFVSMPLHRFDQLLYGQSFPCVQFASRTSPVFTAWHSRFYCETGKVVPNDISRDLTPLAVAISFMDDGAADYAGLTLQTHSFRALEVDILAEALRERFDLTTNVRRNKGHWLIYVRAVSVQPFRHIVEPYLLPEFAYKLVPRRTRTP